MNMGVLDMPAQVLVKAVDVRNRLDELGFSPDQLLEVVGAMVAARNSCTENHPSSAPGWYAWSEGCRRLREVALLKEGWDRDETHGVPAVINRQRGIKIAVCNTDDGTCRESGGRIPQNRTKKGPATDRVAADNRQLPLPGFEPKPYSASDGEPFGSLSVYYLCVFHETDDVRAELSCPSSTNAGFFSDFVERIFLLGVIDGDDGGVTRKDDTPGGEGGEEFDIPVIRKQ